jgi:hypothetical protein
MGDTHALADTHTGGDISCAGPSEIVGSELPVANDGIHWPASRRINAASECGT